MAEPKPIHIGDRFGYWTVIGLNDGRPEHQKKVLCRCICGKVRWTFRAMLRRGRTKSCGCKKWALRRPRDYGIHPGDKIGYWTILQQDRNCFICRCICGKERKIPVYRLMSGESLSCGCQKYQGRQEEIKAAMKRGAELRDKLSQSNLAIKYAGFGRQQNRNSTTGATGVSKTRNGKYRAYITVDRKQIALGTFADIEDAITARKEAEQRYFADRQEEADKIKASFRTTKPDTKEPRH